MAGKAIGVFDSGFGGLDVMRGIVRKLPEYNYVYLGDSAHAPYGPRTSDELYEFCKRAVDFLFAHECALIIFACNTASSDALHTIQHEYLPQKHAGKKVLGVLIPFSEEAVAKTKNKKIGVIATVGTVKSGTFERELQKIDPTVEVYQKACPLLVPLVEAGEQDTARADTLLREYLAPVLAQQIDTLILGCTHYGLLKEKIRNIVGPHVNLIFEENVIPEKLRSYLEKHKEIEKSLAKDSTRTFFTTDPTDRFEKLGSKFFGATIHAQKVEL